MCGVVGAGKGLAGYLLGKQELRREGPGAFLRAADGSASHDFGKRQCRCSIEEQVGNLVGVGRMQTLTRTVVSPCRVHDDNGAVPRSPRSDGVDGVGAQLDRLELYVPPPEEFFRVDRILRGSTDLRSQPVRYEVALVVGIPLRARGDLIQRPCLQCV